MWGRSGCIMAVVGSTSDICRAPEPTFPPEAVLAGTARCGVNAVVTDDSQIHVLSPAMRTATLDCANLTSQFSVTEKDVNDTFFLHERSHGGKVPINEHGRLEEAGWLWSMVVNREAPAMPTTLADAFSYRLDTGSSEALLAVAPPGAGKTFGAWQLGMSRYVDYLDANPANIVSVFSKLKQEIIRKDFDDKLLLQPGETVDTVPDTKLNSRKALYHTWILLHALATMRGQCKSPGDWLFLQLFRPDHVLQGYRAAVRVWRRNVLPYAALKLIDSARDAKGHASGRAVLVLDEASHALPDNNQPRFARLRDATPQTLPAATPRDATGRPSLDPSSGLYVGVNRLLSEASTVAAAVGVGAGAGRERATNLPNASATGDQGETSQTGLLGCLLQAAMVYKTRMIVMGTSFSFTHAQDLVWSGCDHPGSMRSVRPQDIVSYMKSADFPQLSATECGDCIRFYANLLNIELDNSLLTVCQQLQGA